jgi:type IX secretion system PorP/SprF family membrane protein
MKNFKPLLALFLTGFVLQSNAQLNPLGAQFFQNQYLANPSLAGLAPGYQISAALTAQRNAIEGAPLIQGVTFEKGLQNKKVGLGINFYNESAGVTNRTNLKATYAYHVELDGKKKYVDFGLSAGYFNEWINFDKVKGDLTDISLTNFNRRKPYFDADFGFAYRSGGLTIHGALSNIRKMLDKNFSQAVVDRSIYWTALSYSFISADGTTQVEPKAVYRGVQNYGDIFDIGTNLSFKNEKLILNGIYHSTNKLTFGIGTLYKDRLSISVQYTTNISNLQNYSNGEGHIGIKYKFN